MGWLGAEFEQEFRQEYVSDRVHTVGTAVLGLGDIGPEAAMPVMEGKAMLFKQFGGIDAYPICANAHSVEEIVAVARTMAPGDPLDAVYMVGMHEDHAGNLRKRIEKAAGEIAAGDSRAMAAVMALPAVKVEGWKAVDFMSGS